MEGIFKDLTKFLTRVVILTILVLVLGSILDISFEPWVKIVIPKPSIKIEDNVSRETLNTNKQVYWIDGVYMTKAEFEKRTNKEKKPRKGKGLKLTGSGRTRSTTKGDISYGNGRP